MEARKSESLAWKGFRGERIADLDLRPLLEIIGKTPLSTLPGDGRVTLVKAKHDKGSRVYRAVLDLGFGEEDLFIKTFETRETFRVMTGRMFSRKGLARPLHYPQKLVRMLFEPSLSKRCWDVSKVCEKSGIPVAEHLMHLSRKKGVCREEVIVTRGINPRTAPDARLFFDYYFRPPATRCGVHLKRELIARLGGLLRLVYDSGIMFPDFKLHNLVLEEPPGQLPRFVVIDLSEALPARPDYREAVFLKRFSPSLPGPPVFTTADRIRLLKAYLRAGQDKRSWRDLCREMDGRSGLFPS